MKAIHFVASPALAGQSVLASMQEAYGQVPLEQAEVIVALGGDGFMLRTLHRYIEAGLPVYGMRTGNVGFLMNRFEQDGLVGRLAVAQEVGLHPLRNGFAGGGRGKSGLYKCPPDTPPAPGKHCDSVQGSTSHGEGELPEPTGEVPAQPRR